MVLQVQWPRFGDRLLRNHTLKNCTARMRETFKCNGV